MRPLLTVLQKECRESLRDRRVLLNGLLIGPLLGPLLLVALLRFTIGHQIEQAERPLPVSISGGQWAPNLIQALQQEGIEWLPASADLEAALRSQRIDVALRVPTGYGADWLAGMPAHVELLYDSSRQESQIKAQRLRATLESISRRTAAMRLIVRGIAPTLLSPIAINDRDQATAQARGALWFSMLPYFLILTAFLGGMWLAIDAVAGERERQSLEPLLTTPAPVVQILAGKWLATCVFSFASLTLGLLAFAAAAPVLPAAALDMDVVVGPSIIGRALLLMLPLVLLLSIAQILVASFARSYREAQTYLGLLQLLPIIPSVLLSLSPSVPPLWLYGLPIVGQQLTLMQWLRGAEVAAQTLILSSVATLALVALLFVLARRRFESEELAISA